MVALAKKLASEASNIDGSVQRDVRFHSEQTPILRFKSKKEYREAVYAMEALADLGERSIEVSSALSAYVDRNIYLPASELSFFNHEGRLIVGDTLAMLKQDKLVATSLATGEKQSFPLAMNAYSSLDGVSLNRLCGPNEDPPGCEEPPPPPPPCDDCGGGDGDDDDGGGGDPPNPTVEYSRTRSIWSESDNQYYTTRAVAANKSYTTGFPFYRSWSKALTYLQVQDNGVWYDLEQEGFFPDMLMKATVISDKFIIYNCDTRSKSATDTDGAVVVDQDRCDGTGTRSSGHRAEAAYSPFIWPGGALEIDLL